MKILPAFTKTKHPSLDPFLDKVFNADALDLLRALPDNSIDMVLADLPYGVTEGAWDIPLNLVLLWEQLERVIKVKGAIVLTSTQPFTSILISSNYSLFKYEWIWIKNRPTMFIHAKNRPMQKHESILIFSKGVVLHEGQSKNKMNYYPQKKRAAYYKKKDVGIVGNGSQVGYRKSHKVGYTYESSERYPNTILSFKGDSISHSYHPTQKPVALFEYLIKTYTQVGETVLDMVCGSGTTAIAARKTGRNFICGDITPEYVQIARKRLMDSDPYQATQVTPEIKQLSLFGEFAS
jgi:site-specific DNA-methyltransferase (adenine-specific)